MRKIGGFILTAIGIFIIYLGVKGLFSVPEYDKAIRNAIIVEDGRLDPANEGKLVIVSGKLKSEQQLQDPLTGVKLPGVAARRVVWTYERLETKDKEDYITWDWMEEFIDFTEAPYYGINADTQVTTILVAPTTIGDFQVDNNFFSEISFTDSFTDYNENNLKEGWYIHSKDKEAKYSVSKDEELSERAKYYCPYEFGDPFEPWDSGRQKISYKIFSPENPMVYTLLGIQKGDTIIRDTNVSPSNIYEGTLTLDDFAKESGSSIKAGSIFGLVIGFLVTLGGVRKILFRGYSE